jgi:peptidoglycan/xylan/chitin deacetylase (PgdA/CDA1 family)
MVHNDHSSASIKRFVLDTLSSERLFAISRLFATHLGVVFYAHRFADIERESAGHNPATLRRDLELLRRHRFNLVSIASVVQRLHQGLPLLPHTVAFTVDDGYADFSRVAAPIFAAYDCPVTVFLTTGFVDRISWMWWDQIAFVLDRTDHHDVEVEIGSAVFRGAWSSTQGGKQVAERIVTQLKSVTDDVKCNAMLALAAALDVQIPAEPPTEYLPMTWDDVRACERSVTTFGAHTVTHPILSQIDDARARQEISQSWQRVQENVIAPVPVFCYPNGTPDSYSTRDVGVLRELGLIAGVSTEAQYVDATEYRSAEAAKLFNIPRFGYPEPGGEYAFRQIVGGVERGRSWMRRRSLVRR